jgi:hypothetical protein
MQMDIIRKIKDFKAVILQQREYALRKKILHKKIVNAKVVHFMFNDKFAKDISDFFWTFQKGQHIICCRRLFSHPIMIFPSGEHVLELLSYNDLRPSDLVDKKLVFHSLFDPESINFLYKNQYLLLNSFWYIWGGDMYNCVDDEKALYVKTHFKKYFLENDMEEEKFVEKYGNVSGKFEYNGIVYTGFHEKSLENITNKKII